MKVRGILFDFDDTIVKSEDSRFESLKKVLRDENITFTRKEWDSEYRSLGSVPILDLLKKKYFKKYDSEELYLHSKEIREIIEDKGVELVAGFKELIKELDRREIKYLICSGGRGDHVQDLLKQHNLEDIDGFGREDYENRKPAPDAFLEGLKRLQLSPEEVIIFEDSYSGIQSGIATGCRVFGVNTNEHEQCSELAVEKILKDFTEFDLSYLN